MSQISSSLSEDDGRGRRAKNEPLIDWHLYFPDSEPSPEDPKYPIIQALAEFFQSRREYLKIDELKKHGRISIDYACLQTEIPVQEFSSVLKTEPDSVLGCLCLAVHNAIIGLGHPPPSTKVKVRLLGYAPITPLRDLKSNFVDKFVALKGNVVRVGIIKPLVTTMGFDCARCGIRIVRSFADGRYNPPVVCEGKCKSKYFIPNRKSATAIDWQLIRIQEILNDRQRDQGRIPRTIDCELTEDLVDCCIPGDVVTIAGVVKARRTELRKGGRGRNKCLFVLYVDVNSVANGNQNEDGQLDVMDFRESDMVAIREIAYQEGLFKLIIHSLCPSIYGHELVKAGLCLALFGGCQKNGLDRNRIAVRGDPHVLIVGDPGLGKSQLLRSVSKLAPRGVYVCGNTTTSSGLTVTMVREGKGGGDYALEAGALVLADQGCCCIDEFDKMQSEHNALLEAMEQQSISIAKAGIVSTLAARTSVIAAANPVAGHYDRARTVAENLKISAPLLSRFDIIFILLDRPDERRDELLSEHVIAMHTTRGKDGGTPATPTRAREEKEAFFLTGTLSDWTKQKPLAERLRLTAKEVENFEPLPPHIFRKYIFYARQYVKPTLSSGAKKVLSDFYLKLRKEHQSADCTPITTRQLESMIRLAEARAKLELREVVTPQDALDVVDIMKESLYDIFSDEFGHVDFKRSRGVSKSKQVQLFMRALHKAAERRQCAIFSTKEMYDISKEINLGVENFEAFIDSLNNQNFILNKGNRKYQVRSSTFAM